MLRRKNVKFKFYFRKPKLKQKAVIFNIISQAYEMATSAVKKHGHHMSPRLMAANVLKYSETKGNMIFLWF